MGILILADFDPKWPFMIWQPLVFGSNLLFKFTLGRCGSSFSKDVVWVEASKLLLLASSVF